MRDKFANTKFLLARTRRRRLLPTNDLLIRACEASLRRLQSDHIDLYQIHAFVPLTRPEEVATALNELRRQGKVRWLGVSNLNPEQMRMYARYFEINSLQPPYSALQRDVERAELPYCLDQRIGVIAYSPLSRGLLSGKYAPETTFSDNRAKLPEFQGSASPASWQRSTSLRPLAADYGLTLHTGPALGLTHRPDLGYCRRQGAQPHRRSRSSRSRPTGVCRLAPGGTCTGRGEPVVARMSRCLV